MTGYRPASAYGRRRRPSRARIWLRRFVGLAVVAAFGLGAWWVVGAVSSGGPDPDAVPRGSPSATASASASPSPEPTAPPLPVCEYRDQPAKAIGYKAWKRTLVDTSLRLPETYVPPRLVSTTRAGFADDDPVRSVVIDDLGDLRRAARAAGNPVGIVAGYRSYEQQAILFEQREDELGPDEAQMRVARAGHSEHQLGTAVDFKIEGHRDVTIRFGNTKQGWWLLDHAWRYGFLLSYPFGATLATCYSSEPWHYRYFGKEMAGKIHDSGLTTREYLWNLQFGVTP